MLEVECGDDVLEISLNGDDGQVLPWHPYRLDITDRVRPGRNHVELKVTNTLVNLLEGVRRPSGLRSIPKIVHRQLYTLTDTGRGKGS